MRLRPEAPFWTSPGLSQRGDLRLALTAPRGGGVATAAPVNLSAPTITGIQTVGQTLTVLNGEWTQFPTTFAYQWKRGVTNIGTNSASYLQVTADGGQSITCTVTASNVGFGAGTPAVSNAVTPAAVLAVTGTPDSTGDEGAAYSFVPGVTGGHQSGVTNGWSLSGSLTGSGLAFDTASGALTATSLGLGATYGPFNIIYTDADGLTASVGGFSITVSEAGDPAEFTFPLFFVL